MGWYQLRNVADFIELDIWGRRVFVHPITLGQLARIIHGCSATCHQLCIGVGRPLLDAFLV